MHKINHASVAHKITVQRKKPTKHNSMNIYCKSMLKILDLCRTPETDSTNPWGSIEPRLRTTGIDKDISFSTLFTQLLYL